nr:histidine kinase [Paenibacillus lentus]
MGKRWSEKRYSATSNMDGYPCYGVWLMCIRWKSRKSGLCVLASKFRNCSKPQAQINPHFLYNTLSSISRLAKFGEIDKLQKMVLDLAKFYRLSLNEGRTVIPIRHELEQADRIRFKVIDNGLGMSPVLIRRMFDPMEGQNVGFGIRNVNSRIQLHFGAEYGVTIGSRPGVGTTVQIVIPATPYFPEEGV